MMNHLALPLAIAMTVLCRSALADDLPDLKAGLWESFTSVRKGVAPMRSTMCMDSTVYKRLDEKFRKDPQRPCKRTSQEHIGSTFTLTAVCNFHGKPTQSKTVMIMSGNTAYHSEVHSEDQSVGVVIDAKYVGACPAGMKLGDMTGPDGKVMANILE
jgi:hypothetical protein